MTDYGPAKTEGAQVVGDVPGVRRDEPEVVAMSEEPGMYEMSRGESEGATFSSLAGSPPPFPIIVDPPQASGLEPRGDGASGVLQLPSHSPDLVGGVPSSW